MEKKFKERYLDGEITCEEIDDYVDTWNNSDEPCSLREYLGLNAEEEDVWIEDSDEALQELLDRQKRCIHRSAWTESFLRKGWRKYVTTAGLR